MVWKVHVSFTKEAITRLRDLQDETTFILGRMRWRGRKETGGTSLTTRGISNQSLTQTLPDIVALTIANLKEDIFRPASSENEAQGWSPSGLRFDPSRAQVFLGWLSIDFLCKLRMELGGSLDSQWEDLWFETEIKCGYSNREIEAASEIIQRGEECMMEGWFGSLVGKRNQKLGILGFCGYWPNDERYPPPIEHICHLVLALLLLLSWKPRV